MMRKLAITGDVLETNALIDLINLLERVCKMAPFSRAFFGRAVVDSNTAVFIVRLLDGRVWRQSVFIGTGPNTTTFNTSAAWKRAEVDSLLDVQRALAGHFTLLPALSEVTYLCE